MAKSRKKQRGSTLVELLTASGVTTLVLLGSLSILFAGSASWAQGVGKIGAETDAQMSVRTVSEALSEAMSVTVDPNGMGLSYRVPLKDASGDFALPVTWDGVNRRIEVEGTKLAMIDGGNKRIIASGLIFTDPVSVHGSKPYELFTPGQGNVTRQVTIEVATKRLGFHAKPLLSRSRETIFLRNIPVLTK